MKLFWFSRIAILAYCRYVIIREEKFTEDFTPEAGFPLAIFFARSAFISLSLSFQLKPCRTINWVCSKERGRLIARKNSLVEKSTAITGNDRRRYQRHTDENQHLLKQISSETALNDTSRVKICVYVIKFAQYFFKRSNL